MADTPANTDPDGSKDYGNIDALSESEGGYAIAGDFGTVAVKAKGCSFSIT